MLTTWISAHQITSTRLKQSGHPPPTLSDNSRQQRFFSQPQRPICASYKAALQMRSWKSVEDLAKDLLQAWIEGKQVFICGMDEREKVLKLHE